MSDTDWPAWMPEPTGIPIPDVAGRPFGIIVKHSDLLAWYAAAKAADPDSGSVPLLLAWYAAAKAADPDFGSVTLPRKPLSADVDFEAGKRAAFPLPEDGPDDGA